MEQKLDTKYIMHAAIVGYALSKALLEMLDGAQVQSAAKAALKFLPPKPPQGDSVKMWLNAEAELKKMGGIN
jgi:hypothetical protein